MKNPRFLRLSSALVFPLLARLAAAEPSPRYQVVPFEIEGPIDKIVPADLDGDGLRDLLAARGPQMDVYFQDGAKGFGFSKPDVTLRLDGASPPGESEAWETPVRESIAWDVARLSATGAPQVVALIGGAELKVWPLQGGARRFEEGRALLSGLSAALPAGIRHMPFVRDIDGDGDGDFVIPEGHSYRIYLRGADGAYKPGASVPQEMEWKLELDGKGDLSAEIGQSVTFPLFDLRDVNGDSRKDLVSRTEDRLEVYLAEASGVFPRSPSYALDLEAERESLGKFEVDDLDFSNLTGALARSVQVVHADADGDGIQDVLLRAGGRHVLFLGQKGGLDLRKPHQVLKSSGNVLFALIEDEDEDGRPDLWVLRVEKVSLGDVFLWLIASGSLEFEIFIYRNEGGRFARRPSRQLTLRLLFPAIRSLLADSQKEKPDEKSKPPSLRADLTGSGRRGDIVVLREGRLDAFLGKAGRAGEAGARPGRDLPERLLLEVLEKLGYSREKDEYEVKVEDLPRLLSPPEEGLAGEVEGAAPDFQFAVPGAGGDSELIILDLGGDGRSDFLVIFQQDRSAVKGAIAVSRS